MPRGLLAGGVALVVGGAALVVAATAPEEARTDRWTALAPAPLERTEVAAARIGRFIYVVGGFERGSGRSTGAVERYDIRRNRWRRLRSMPLSLDHATAAPYRGRLYVHGGYTAGLSRPTNALLEYDPTGTAGDGCGPLGRRGRRTPWP